MSHRPKLTLVKNCGIRRSVLQKRVNVGAQLMPRDLSIRSSLDPKNFLGRYAAALLQPLPDHALSDTHSVGKLGLSNTKVLQVGGELHAPILATLVPEVNSKLLDSLRRAKHVSLMPTRSRPKPGAGIAKEVMKAEGLALGALWKAHAKRSQEDFSEEMGFSQGNFSHYIGGRRPIPLDIGLLIAKELDCALADFSPRLASEELEMRQVPVTWPFANLSFERFYSLTPGQRLQMEGSLLEQIERLEAAAKQRRKSG